AFARQTLERLDATELLLLLVHDLALDLVRARASPGRLDRDLRLDDVGRELDRNEEEADRSEEDDEDDRDGDADRLSYAELDHCPAASSLEDERMRTFIPG